MTSSFRLEHKAYWVPKQLNYDFKLVGEKMLLDMCDLINGGMKLMKMLICLKSDDHCPMTTIGLLFSQHNN